MCTSIAMFSPSGCCGRNLDLDVSFGEQVVITPRLYPFSFSAIPALPTHYAMIGMASVINDHPLYAEAMNEHGLYMAGLNFPGNAWYDLPMCTGDKRVAPHELIPWILGSCRDVTEAKNLLSSFAPLNRPFALSADGAQTLPSAPLHWHICDSGQALVLEITKTGVHLYEDSIGVLTNNPPFPFHQMHLNQYLGLSAGNPDCRFAPDVPLRPFCEGMGALGLPGDASSPSRYVKAAFHKLNAPFETEESKQVCECFHILDAVAMVNGSVCTSDGHPEYTIYTCCISAASLTYYYKTYENPQITAITLHDGDKEGTKLQCFPLRNTWDVCRIH